MIWLSGEKWHTRRKLLTPAFHFNVLQNFLAIFNQKSRTVVEVLKKHVHQEIDVVSLISKFTLDTICGMYSYIIKTIEI